MSVPPSLGALISVRFTLRQLEYLSAIAEFGSISAAAAHVHTSPGGVSLAIKDLEQRLGVQLFLRQKAKSVTLTDAGVRVLREARELIAAASNLQLVARSTQTEISGTLNIACYSTMAPFVIPTVLDDFASDHPALQVEIVEGSRSQILSALEDGRAEIAFLYAIDAPPQLDTIKLRSMRPYVILPAGHPLASKGSVQLAQLADEPLIMFDGPSARNATEVLHHAGLSPHIRHFTANIELVRSLVARGLGYSIMVQRWPTNVSYEGRRLVSCEIEDKTAEREMVLGWITGTRRTKRVDALIKFCRRAFASEPQLGPPESSKRHRPTVVGPERDS